MINALRNMLFLLSAPLAISSASASPHSMAGRWVLKSDDVGIFALDIRCKRNQCSGVWERPAKFSLGLEEVSGIIGGVARRNSNAVKWNGVELVMTFPDPDPNEEPDVFRLKLSDNDHVLLNFVGIDSDPWILERNMKVKLGPWSESQTYPLTVNYRSNSQMAMIFEEDQKDREDEISEKLLERDRVRREKTMELLNEGKLKSGDDFSRAAFIFQHGEKSEDYLRAHVLAMIAVARGNKTANWIAAAALDRYLVSLSKKQVFGTQFKIDQNGNQIHEPVESDLLPESVLKTLRIQTPK